MVVDDSSVMRQIITTALQSLGLNVRTADNGQDALEKLSDGPADLVITDINMPVMDGLSLVRRLRNRPSYRFVPILVLTTESSDEMKQRGRAAGATGWIVKPFSPRQLCQISCQLLRLPWPDSQERAVREP